MIALKMVAGSTIHCQLNALGSITTWAVDGALRLEDCTLVIGGDSCSEGRRFDFQHCVLDGHFSH